MRVPILILAGVIVLAIFLNGADDAAPRREAPEPTSHALGDLEFRTDDGWDAERVLAVQNPVDGPRMSSSTPGGGDDTELSFRALLDVRVTDAQLLVGDMAYTDISPVLAACTDPCEFREENIIERGPVWQVPIDSPGFHRFIWAVQHEGTFIPGQPATVAVVGRWDITGEVYPVGTWDDHGATDHYTFEAAGEVHNYLARTHALEGSSGDLALSVAAPRGTCHDDGGIEEWDGVNGVIGMTVTASVGHPEGCNTPMQNTAPVAYGLSLWLGPNPQYFV